MHYLGVDVSKATLEVSDTSGKSRRTFQNSTQGVRQLLRWAESLLDGRIQIVLEPTSTYHHLLLEQLGRNHLPFTVINPARTKAYASLQARRAKTDKVDAQLLASLGESQHLKPSHRPDPAQEQLKSLRRHREWLERQVVATKNRLEAASHSPWADNEVLRTLRSTIRHFQRQVGALERKMQDVVSSDETLSSLTSLLETIPAVGRKTALLLLSEMPPAGQCDNARAWVAFSGVCPQPRQSGRTSYSRLSRMGSRRVRAQLYLSAVSAMRWNPPVAALVERLKERGKGGKLVVMAAMNMLIRICFGVVKNRRPFEPSLHLQIAA